MEQVMNINDIVQALNAIKDTIAIGFLGLSMVVFGTALIRGIKK
jgi:hypothetical protein